MEKKIVKDEEDCNKCQRTDAVPQAQLPAKPANVVSHSTKMCSPAYILQSDIIKNALESRCHMRQATRGTLQVQLPIMQVMPMFNNAVLHPLRCSPLPDFWRKMVEKGQQTNQADADVRTVVQVPARQVSVRQVVAMLTNATLLPLKHSILTAFRKIVGGNCQINQKERPKVSTPLRPTEAVKSASNNPENFMTWARLTLPISPAVALKNFQDQLTRLEQEEVLEFLEIWYLGLGAEKMKGSQETQENSEDPSFSYDDAKGIYTPVIFIKGSIIMHQGHSDWVMRDHIAYRYEILEKLGQGSFGLVLKCLDHKIKEMVALKIIHNRKSANRMALRELEILEVVRREDKENRFNVIHMKEHMTFRKHLCITFELQRLIRNNHFQGFTLSQTHHYAVALVISLQMLHRLKIVHCDLKPENILLSEKTHGNIKVADFGCSFYGRRKGHAYVQTRFYRAPEVLLGLPFGTAIDMWSLGCILAELYIGTPLFPGSNEVDQLACITELRTVIRRQSSSRDLAKVLKNADMLFVDFIRRCLVWDPTQRMTADESACHQWVQEPLKMLWRGGETQLSGIQRHLESETHSSKKRACTDHTLQGDVAKKQKTISDLFKKLTESTDCRRLAPMEFTSANIPLGKLDLPKMRD
ncbi:hypothetical protein AAFF_G00343280 [Aldrovandia affinis]|uniref:dual-specificity kinase n=1 Tax=Aldrovandia affinis TaxID=143900 RepID=A0AAD7WP95_9TELE|nr:hypothetical protein AAFF_G00343280 [Aldrovandia affinis]